MKIAFADRKTWSLTIRLIVMVVATVAVTLALFTLLTVMRLEQGADRQEKAIATLAWDQFEEQLRLQGTLIASELIQIRKETADAARNLAGRPETAAVLQRGNIVAIDMMLKQAAENGQFDGLLALDVNLKAIGSHQPGLVLSVANDVFSASPLVAAARGLVQANDRDDPKSMTQFQPGKSTALASYGIAVDGDVLEVVSLQPVFDEFGDVIALLLAHKVLNADSPALARFARSENLGIRVLEGDQVLLNAHIDAQQHRLPPQVRHGVMDKTRSGDYLFHCARFGSIWQLCVYEPNSNLQEQASKLVDFIRTEKRDSMLWLATMALISVVVATLMATVATSRVMAPMHQITRAVHAVARGNWMVHVAGQKRRDEIGDMARSVAVLQQSVKEREVLQADVADVDHLRDGQRIMAEAAYSCRGSLRQLLFGLSDLTETIDGESRKLLALVDLSEAEADEARLAIKRAFDLREMTGVELVAQAGASDHDTPFKLALDTVDRLGETVGELGGASRLLDRQVKALSSELTSIDQIVKDFMRSIAVQRGASAGFLTADNPGTLSDNPPAREAAEA